MATKRDPEIAAVETVHAALKPLDPEARQRVTSSVYALLDIAGAADTPRTGRGLGAAGQPIRSSPIRPMALVELMQDKSPGTNAQRLALFAYYREKYEGKPRFARADLRPYFAKAREHPPKNFDRDFVEAVRRGWVHEEEEDSYITSKGVEAAEAGFPGERVYKRKAPPRKVSGKKKHRRKKAAKSRRKSSR